MKKTILIIAIVFSGMLMQAQVKKATNSQKNYEVHVYGTYDYYAEKYYKAKKNKRIGIVLTSIGVGFGAAAGITYLANDHVANNAVAIMTGTSIAFFNVGVPIWLINGILESNNKTAMSRTRARDLSLNIASTNNGVGLVLRF